MLADLTDVTLVSEVAAHNYLQMSSSRDLTDESEDAAHNYFRFDTFIDCHHKAIVLYQLYADVKSFNLHE